MRQSSPFSFSNMSLALQNPIIAQLFLALKTYFTRMGP